MTDGAWRVTLTRAGTVVYTGYHRDWSDVEKAVALGRVTSAPKVNKGPSGLTLLVCGIVATLVIAAFGVRAVLLVLVFTIVTLMAG